MATIATILEDFNRPDGVLGTGPSGVAPIALRGTPRIVASQLYFAEAADTNPLVVWDCGASQVEITVNVPPVSPFLQAIYFRVVDANNWWRLRLFQTIEGQTYFYTESERTCYYESGGISTTITTWGDCPSTYLFGNLPLPLRSSTLTGQTRQVASTTNYTTYRVVVESCVNGVITGQAGPFNVGTRYPTQLRVRAVGPSIWCWTDLNDQPLNADPTLQSNYLLDATRHGVGMGGSLGGIAGARFDNLSIVPRVRPPSAPILRAPVGGSFIDATDTIDVIHDFADLDLPADWETAHAIRIRTDDGPARYLSAGGTLSPEEQKLPTAGKQVQNITTPLPADTLANGHRYQLAVKSWDSLDLEGSYGPEVAFTASRRPEVFILAPEQNEAIDGTSVSVSFDFTADFPQEWLAAWVERADTPGAQVALTGRTYTDRTIFVIDQLPPVGQFILFLQVAQEGGLASRTVAQPFTTNARPPIKPVLAAADLGGDVRIDVQLLDNLLSEEQADFEAGISGVEVDRNATISHAVGVGNTRVGSVRVEPVATTGTGEVQSVTVTATGGTFTLSFGGSTTTALAFNAPAADVQAALQALPSIGAGNVTVTGGPGGTAAYTVTFPAAMGDVAQMTANGAALTGTTVSIAVTTTTQGVAPVALSPAAIRWTPVPIHPGVQYGSRVANTYQGVGTAVRLIHRYLDASGLVIAEVAGPPFQQVGGVNRAPIAHLTGPTSILEGQAFSLDATASHDPEGEQIAYSYRQLEGAAVTLAAATTGTPTGTAPATAQTLTFEVSVTDPLGAVGTDTHSIAVRPAGTAGGGGGDLDTAGREQRLVQDAAVLWSLNFDRLGATLDDVLLPACGRVHYGYKENAAIDTPPSPVPTAAGAASGSRRALRARNPYPDPAREDNRWGVDFRVLFDDMDVAQQTTTFLRYYVFIPADYEWTQGKLPGLMGVRPGFSPWTPAGGTSDLDGGHNSNQWASRVMWQPDRSLITYLDVVHAAGRFHEDNLDTTGQMVPLSVRFLQGATATSPASDGTRLTLVPGAWNLLEQEVVLNTPGVNDGVFRGWVNGALGVDLRDVQYRATGRADVLINEFNLAWFHGGGIADYPTRLAEVWFDDFVLSKSYIGERTD